MNNYRVSIILFTILFLVSSIFFPNIEAKSLLGEDTESYVKLFEIGKKDLDDYIGEKSLLDNDQYKEAISEKTIYPMRSYYKLMNIFLSSFPNNFSNVKKLEDELVQLKTELRNLSDDLSYSEIKTFKEIEWYSFAKKNLDLATNYFNNAGEYFYGHENYEKAYLFIKNCKSSLKTVENTLVLIASMNYSDHNLTSDTINYLLKNISQKWITIAEISVRYVDSFGRTGPIKNCYKLLNESKNYLEENLYYLSLMKSAETKAIAEYLSGHAEYISKDEGLRICEVYLNLANLSLSRVYKEDSIDAPFAQLYFEESKLHFRDAKNARSEGTSASVISIAIKESFIASEQAKAALNLRLELSNFLNSKIEQEQNSELLDSDNKSTPAFNLTIFMITTMPSSLITRIILT